MGETGAGAGGPGLPPEVWQLVAAAALSTPGPVWERVRLREHIPDSPARLASFTAWLRPRASGVREARLYYSLGRRWEEPLALLAPSLASLDLSGHVPEAAVRAVAADCQQLTFLYLWLWRPLALGQLAVVTSLTSLTGTDPDDENCGSFPPELCALTRLTFLSFSSYSGFELPEEASQLVRLQELVIMGSTTFGPTPALGRLQGLTKLRFENCILRGAGWDCLRHLRRLRVLQFTSGCCLEGGGIPEAVCSLRQLEAVGGHFGGNWGAPRPLVLPDNFSRLCRLTKLELDAAEFRSVPAVLWTLTGLRTLSLSANFLHEVGFGLGQLTNLRSLNLSSVARVVRQQMNDCFTVPAHISCLCFLEVLDLSENRLGGASGIAALACLQHATALLFVSTEPVDGSVRHAMVELKALLQHAGRIEVIRPAEVWDGNQVG